MPKRVECPLENHTRMGFTLIELIIIIVAVGIFLPGMFTAMQTGVIDESENQFDQQQLCLIETAMEEIIADKSAPGRGFTYLSPGNYRQDTGIDGFTRKVKVTDLRVMGRPAKTVSITLSKPGISDISLTATYLENW